MANRAVSQTFLPDDKVAVREYVAIFGLLTMFSAFLVSSFTWVKIYLSMAMTILPLPILSCAEKIDTNLGCKEEKTNGKAMK